MFALAAPVLLLEPCDSVDGVAEVLERSALELVDPVVSVPVEVPVEELLP